MSFLSVLTGIGTLVSPLLNQASPQKTTESGSKTMAGQAYNDTVLSGLNNLMTAAMQTGNFGTSQDALTGRLSQVQTAAGNPTFDVDAFTSGITQQATAATQMDLDSQINGMLSSTGSSETGNSMSALLGQKMRNNAAANLAGITSNARATGEQIKMQQGQALTGEIASLTDSISNQILALMQVGKNAATAATESSNTTQTNREGLGTSFNNMFSVLRGSSLNA